MVVREMIEMLAKCNWDSEISCANADALAILTDDEQKKANYRITAVSQSTRTGVQIIFQDDEDADD